MKVLVTGFDPFGGESINPALEAVKLLPNQIGAVEVIKLEIPTVFQKSLEKIEEAIEMYKPDAVISIGQAGGRFGVTPERVAINVDDARIADNQGNVPVDTKVFEEGENAYFTNLPIKAMTQAMIQAGIPASVSNTAGTFVCNHVMYGVLYMIHKKYPHMKGGFIHVPYIPAQVTNKPSMPSMSLTDIAKGLEICIQVVGEREEDMVIAAGAIC
ncbi:MAG: pyroglutamyl-peptidase I [Cellulosilyticaceae bacterium]